MAYDWGYANKLSYRIIDMLNAELETPEFKEAGPIQMLAGMTTAMLSFMDSSNSVITKPESFLVMRDAMVVCLKQMHHAMKETYG